MQDVLGVTSIETAHQTLPVVVKWKVRILILRLVFESIVHYICETLANRLTLVLHYIGIH